MISVRSVRVTGLTAGAALLAAVFASADPPERPVIEGRWRGTSANAKGISYEFKGRSSAVYHRASGPADIAYQLYWEAPPAWSLNLLGFPPGPYQEKVLYCIVEVDQDRLRLACEPGGEKDTAAAKRPKAFGGPRTQEFVREPATGK